MSRNLTLLFRTFFFMFASGFTLNAAAQCPIGLELGTQSVVTNGDFSAGNTGFVSDHNFCATPGCLLQEGKYTVAADPSIYQSSFSGADHTTGTGDFLIVNGSTTANSTPWCQTFPVDPNSFYIVSYWLTSLVEENPAAIKVTMNTFPFFGALSAPPVNQWSNFSQTWTSGLNTSITMCLVNTNNNSTGNDFGIDDITVSKCECALLIDAGSGGAVCYGDSVLLDASGATSYYWTPTSSVNCFTCENPVATPQSTTTYTVTASGPGGCTATDTVTVVIHPPVNLHAAPDTTICFGEKVQLSADGADFYQWSPSTGLSDPNIANPLSTPDASVSYFLFATDQFGCKQYDSLRISVFPYAGAVIASNDTMVCAGETVILNVNHYTGVSWTPTDFLSCVVCSQPLCFPDSDIIYVVSVTDSNNCFLGIDSVVILVDDSCNIIVPPALALPSAFSPNNDGKNDLFHVLGNGIVSADFTVYNRWGQLLFTSSNKDLGWDGTFNGEPQEVGVYVWQLKGQLSDGTIINKSGNVTLVR